MRVEQTNRLVVDIEKQKNRSEQIKEVVEAIKGVEASKIKDDVGKLNLKNMRNFKGSARRTDLDGQKDVRDKGENKRRY